MRLQCAGRTTVLDLADDSEDELRRRTIDALVAWAHEGLDLSLIATLCSCEDPQGEEPHGDDRIIPVWRVLEDAGVAFRFRPR